MIPIFHLVSNACVTGIDETAVGAASSKSHVGECSSRVFCSHEQNHCLSSVDAFVLTSTRLIKTYTNTDL